MSEEHTENNVNKKRSRKKRKNFLINAKKYAKKGQLGRGTKIPDEMYHYFVGILDSMKKGIEDDDERQALVNNVLDRTKENELNIIGNQLGCRVVELLLPYSSQEDFERFLNVISPDLRKLCSDNFTSHVVEALLRISCERATANLQDNKPNSDTEDETPVKKVKLETKPKSKYSKEHLKTCYDFTIKISKYALNNLEDFIWDPYANHILRSVLKCLSGITLLPGEKPKVNMFKEPLANKGIPPNETKINYKLVPDEFKDIVKEFANRLSVWPQFKDLPYENLTSGLLQVMLYAIKNVDKNLTKDLIKKLLDESFAPEDYVPNGDDDKKDIKETKIDVDEGDSPDSNGVTRGILPPVFESEAAVRLLEAALFVSKKKTYTQIYARCFINRLARLAALPTLNYTVQRLIDNCQVKEELEPMFDELSGQFAALAGGNSGVLVALAKACLRLKARQAHFIQKLESALGATDSPYFAVCVLRMTSLDKLDVTSLDKEYFISVHGSVVLQTILDFQRPARAVSSLLQLSPGQLAAVFCDAKGSHVADALCTGQCVGGKARDKLLWKMKGFYQKLALSQHGSRAFESIFRVASPDQKIKIMTELSEKSNLLNSTQYGRLIATKLDVATFKISQKKWEQTVLKGKNHENKDSK